MPLLRDTVYELIRHAILSCEFQPGQELREQMLAQRYRVSRSPIRDSLLRLERENLVTVLPRQGYRVNPISASDIDDLFDLRRLIGPACAAAAAGADDKELRILNQFRGFTEGDFNGSGFAAYDASFHHAVADLSGNRRMAAVARDLIQQVERVMRVAVQELDRESVQELDRELVSTFCVEQDAVIDAIQAHDADRAFRLTGEHAEALHLRILAALSLIRGQGGVANNSRRGLRITASLNLDIRDGAFRRGREKRTSPTSPDTISA